MRPDRASRQGLPWVKGGWKGTRGVLGSAFARRPAVRSRMAQLNPCETKREKSRHGPRLGFARCRWRRRRDSNPRDSSPSTPLAGERLRPLGHVSAHGSTGAVNVRQARIPVDPVRTWQGFRIEARAWRRDHFRSPREERSGRPLLLDPLRAHQSRSGRSRAPRVRISGPSAQLADSHACSAGTAAQSSGSLAWNGPRAPGNWIRLAAQAISQDVPVAGIESGARWGHPNSALTGHSRVDQKGSSLSSTTFSQVRLLPISEAPDGAAATHA